jgi:hypothetical protein
MPRCEVVPAEAPHAFLMDASGIRQADRDEWVGGVGGDVLPALLEALTIPGGHNETFLLDGAPLAMWGVHPIGEHPEVGQVWFLATQEAERHALSIHKVFAPVLAEMHRRHPTLLAYTHPRNTVHHYWMERNGFTFSHTIWTALGIEYLAYTRKAA